MRVLFLAALAPLFVLARPARACAPAPPEGVIVRVAEESAIIAWDAAAHREHFVRRASFHTTGKDFGFLVPTPDKPELAEVPDEIFDRFEEATKPEIKRVTKVELEPTLTCGIFLSRGAKEEAPVAASAPVRVLDTQRVAGYDAAVLEADSSVALAAWLAKHGYAQRAELTDWLAPYVARRWKITAFKIAPDAQSSAAATSAVRMSFTTDRPFFPYREPSDQRETVVAKLPPAARERLLRVFFIGPARVDGFIGSSKTPWPNKPLWTDTLEAAHVPDALPFSVPQGAWLTKFEDKASPRPGTDDLFFAASADTTPIKPPPILWPERERIPIPLDLVAGAGIGTWLLVRAARRRRRRIQNPE